MLPILEGWSWRRKQGTVRWKCSTKVRACIPIAQSLDNVNANHLLHEYILEREKWAQKMKGKGRKKKIERQKNDISTDISVHKNLKNIRGN